MESPPLATTKRLRIAFGISLMLLAGVSDLSAKTYLGKKTVVIDTDGLVITSTSSIGIGTANPVASMDIAGAILFDGMLITPPAVQQNITSIAWNTTSTYHLIFDDVPPVTQSITFSADPPQRTPQAACMLFLLIRRNCGLIFPNSVIWKGNVTGTFPAPASGFQEDIFGFLFDGNGTYYGFFNLDFKADATFPGGR